VPAVNAPDTQSEYHAIKSGAGLCLLGDRLIVRVNGDDRVSFMHGMCTADVKRLAPGMIAPALFLTEHAHVIADCFIYALQEPALWLEVERPRWGAIREHLEKFLVADDVELEELSSLAVLDIEGSASCEAAGGVFGNASRTLEPWRHLQNDGRLIASLPRFGGTAFTVIAERTALGAVVERMKQSCPEMRELNRGILDIVRIEHGLARVGIDTNERTLALEARLDPAISFNKGCYVGQETIERATAHGALKRRLHGLRLTGGELPPAGALIKLEGKEVGRLTSVARSPEAGIIGLTILHHSAWTNGTPVSIAGDNGTVAGSVCELPFSATALTR